MAKFFSRYANHRIKSPSGVIEFQRNECNISDEGQIDFLREHSDFGVVIFEDKKRNQPQEYICPNCGREFKSPQGYAAHLKACENTAGGKGPDEGDE